MRSPLIKRYATANLNSMAKKVHRPGLRVALIVGSALIGLVFPYAFFLTIFFVWTLYLDLSYDSPEYVPPPPPQPRFHGTEADPEWRMYYENQCESPAEEAFLKAMIDSHDMKPGDDALVGNGIRLDMQIKVSPYRLDFVANRTHIIEIDGAAWHSSPEAIQRDRIRDEYMIAKGYKVLRIPAKVVLYTPKEGLRRVDLFLGRIPDPAPTSGMRTSVAALLASASNSDLTSDKNLIPSRNPAPPLTAEGRQALIEQAMARVAKKTDAPKFLVDKSFNPFDLEAEVDGSEKKLEMENEVKDASPPRVS